MPIVRPAEHMQDILNNLVASTPYLEGAAVVNPDGLVVASKLPPGTDEDRVSTMAAALLSLGERTVEELQRGALEQIYVKGATGFTVLMHAGDEWALEAIAGPEAKPGMVLLEMERAVRELDHAASLTTKTQRIELDAEVREELMNTAVGKMLVARSSAAGRREEKEIS